MPSGSVSPLMPWPPACMSKAMSPDRIPFPSQFAFLSRIVEVLCDGMYIMTSAVEQMASRSGLMCVKIVDTLSPMCGFERVCEGIYLLRKIANVTCFLNLVNFVDRRLGVFWVF